MKRAGFTMIELIFVIVILGILAAVAVPKMGETATSAKVQNIESFVGTLNRTVGASMWAKALRNTTDPAGSVAGTTDTFSITDYIDLPQGVTAVNSGLQACDTNMSSASPAFQVASNVIPDVGQIDIYCQDGNSVEQPTFAFDQNGSTKITY